MLPPLMPMVRDPITAPYSVNISWIVINVTFGTEVYSVQYGTEMTMLLSFSEVVEGNTDTSVINEMFSVNITGLIPFTTYYYIVTATNTIGSANTSVVNFTTDETGIFSAYVLHAYEIIVCTAPSISPQGFTSIAITSTTITFQWTDLTRSEANGIIRNYTITYLQGSTPFMVS